MSDGEGSPVQVKVSLRTLAKSKKVMNLEQKSKLAEDKEQLDNFIDNQNKVNLIFFWFHYDFQPITAEVENDSPKQADSEVESAAEQVEKMDIDVLANKELDQMETDVTSEPLPDLIPSVEKPDSRHEPETEVPSLVEKTSPLELGIQNDTSTLDNGNTLVENGAISLEDSLATVEKTVESDVPTVENSFPTIQNPNPLIEDEFQKPPEETVSFAPEVQAPVPTPPPITPVKAPEESLLLDSEDEVEAETEVVIPTKKYLADNNFVLLEDVIKQGVDENNKLKYDLKGIVFLILGNLYQPVGRVENYLKNCV